MTAKLEQLAKFVNGEVRGDGSLGIRGYCSFKRPLAGHIAFAEAEPERGQHAPEAVITTAKLAPLFANAIIVENPRLAFVMVMEYFMSRKAHAQKPAVSDQASIHAEARIGKGVSVGAFAVVEKGAKVGANASIGAGCFIGENAQIGEGAVLHPGVKILDHCEIGARCVINSGTVVGAQGFGFVTTREGHRKFPQVGKVVIEDDVELGANCTVDRAALDETRIGRGTKIDNLVQIAHNVRIGENTLIAAQCGIAGSSTIGSWCVLGGQAGVAGGVEIGDGCVVAGQSGVFSSIPPKTRVSGYPARPHQQSMRVLALTYRLPELTEKIKALEEALKDLVKGKKR
jgi:UDP-3-O-[3-hydroxymyristoyl] glucosamine N-acyltransferase